MKGLLGESHYWRTFDEFWQNAHLFVFDEFLCEIFDAFQMPPNYS